LACQTAASARRRRRALGVRASADAASTRSEKSREEKKRKKRKILSKKNKKKQGKGRGTAKRNPCCLFPCTDGKRFAVRSPDSDVYVYACTQIQCGVHQPPGSEQQDTLYRVAISARARPWTVPLFLVCFLNWFFSGSGSIQLRPKRKRLRVGSAEMSPHCSGGVQRHVLI